MKLANISGMAVSSPHLLFCLLSPDEMEVQHVKMAPCRAFLCIAKVAIHACSQSNNWFLRVAVA